MRFVSRRRLLLLALAALPAIWLGREVWNVLGGQNLHAVIPGKIYRGRQPSPREFERLIEQQGIRTVVNLRGCCNPFPWYLDEARTLQKHGVCQEDVCFSAVHLPSAHELRLLVDVLDRAEYPIFFHCRHGADRTGLASMVALLLHDGVSYADARRQLGLRYGHVMIGKTAVLDRFFACYEEWLTDAGKEHSPANFRHWVIDEYQGGWCHGRIEWVELLAEPKADKPTGFKVRVRNLSKSDWHFKPVKTGGMHLFFNAWDAEGKPAGDGRAALFEATVRPGETLDATVVIPPFRRAGRYRVLIDMVEEYHCWFYQTGAEPWEEELEVRE